MLKNIRIVTLILIIVLIITISIIVIKNRERQSVNNTLNEQEEVYNKAIQGNEAKSQQGSSVLSNEEIETSMTELSETMNNKANKWKLIVNGEKISEREIAYIDFEINNTVINKTQEKKDAISETIKEYAIVQDAREKNIFLTDEENRSVEERIKEQFKKDSEGMNEVLNALNMKYDEFLEFYTAKIKRMEIQTKWILYIGDSIKNGELSTDNKILKQKCKEYQKSKDVTLLLELIEDYKGYLKDKAVVEYIN